MGWQSIIGWMIAAICFVVAVTMLGILASLFDLTSMVMVLFGAPAILLMTYGMRTKLFFVGLYSAMMPRHAQPMDPPQHQQVARMARSFGPYALLSGAAGTFIGCVQMLQNMEDVRSIGPALAVGLLCGFYSVILVMFVFEPMRRHFSERVA